jgi:hypothetical protein
LEWEAVEARVQDNEVQRGFVVPVLVPATAMDQRSTGLYIVRADTPEEAIQAVRSRIEQTGRTHELAGAPEPAPSERVKAFGLAKGQVWFI